MIAIPNGSKNINYALLRKDKRYLRFRLFYNFLYFLAILGSLASALSLPGPYKPWYGYFLAFTFFSTWFVYIVKTILVRLIFGKEAYKHLE